MYPFKNNDTLYIMAIKVKCNTEKYREVQKTNMMAGMGSEGFNRKAQEKNWNIVLKGRASEDIIPEFLLPEQSHRDQRNTKQQLLPTWG